MNKDISENRNPFKNNKKIISILDYGISNLGSINNMLLKIGARTRIVSKEEDVLSAEKLIIPGVGAFDNGIKALKQLRLIEPIKKIAKKDIPILGICLGMQLLGSGSEEGDLEGLSIIPGFTKKFKFNQNKFNFKIPHMGWNFINPDQKHSLLSNLDNQSRFYFVHSYHFIPKDPINSLAKTNYGYDFTSIIFSRNVFGTQFHPEKSHKFGKILLKNFASL